MTFLAPFLAGFAALASIPIIIHLLNRRRFRIVQWAAMEFLLATMKRNARRLQLRDLILMLLRAGALACLALALARPSLTGGLGMFGREGQTTAAVVLDRSLSMSWQDGAESRFARGQRRAREVVEALPRGASAAVVLMGDTADAALNPTSDPAVVADTLSKATPSDGGGDVAAAVERAWALLAAAPATAKELFVVSDFQASGWPERKDARLDRTFATIAEARPGCRLFLVDVGGGGDANLSVDGLRLADEIPSTDTPVTIEATVRNHGRAPLRDVPVECWIGAPGEALRKVSGTVLDEVAGPRPVRFAARLSSGGQHRIEIRAGADRLEADNHAYLVADVLDHLPVLLIDGQGADPADPFAGATGFLQAALSPRDPSGDAQPLIACDRVAPGALAGKRLKDYRVVVLADVRDLPGDLVDALTAYVRGEGGALVVFAGDHVAPGVYNPLLGERADLLPGRIAAPADVPGEGVGFATDELTHPVVSLFEDREHRAFLARPRFRRVLPLELPGEDARGDEALQVVARFADGRPALVERTAGAGSVLVCAFPADKAWGDFPLRPAYVPVMVRAIQHVALGKRPRTTVRVHEPLVDLLPITAKGGRSTVRDPRGGTLTVAVDPTTRGDAAQSLYGRTETAGFYELTRPAVAGAAATVRAYAVNPPAAESLPEAMSREAIAARWPALRFTWIGADEDLAGAIAGGRNGTELWPWLLALCCCCLIAESVLAVRWAPRDAGARP